MQLKAGQNFALSGDTVRFSAEAEVALDISALVVADNLRVIEPEDFVFYNQPGTSGVSLSEGGVTISLAQVRPEAKAVLLVVSADPAAPAAPGLGPVVATLAENSTVTAEFAITPTAGRPR